MSGQLRYASFLERLAAVGDESPTWESLALSYRVLTLLDARVVDGSDADASTISELLSVVRASCVDNATRSHVEPLLAFLSSPEAILPATEVGATLLRWGSTLRSQAYFDLALDVTRAALEHCGSDAELRWQAHRDCGWSLRMLGDYDRAESHYRSCLEIGEDLGRVDAVFRGRIGLAMLARCRGNLPFAERLGAELVAWAIAERRPDFESRARHELAVTLGVRGRYDEGLDQLARVVPEDAPAAEYRLRNDIAFTQLQMGNLTVARDGFIEIVRAADDRHLTFIARVNLIQVFGVLGSRADVEAQRRLLETQVLPADLATDFSMTLGRAYMALGDPAAALPCFERAAVVAERSGMGRLIIESDEAVALASSQLRSSRPAAVGSSIHARAAVPSPTVERDTGLAQRPR